MTHKPNDFKENLFFSLLHSSIHQALMNSWEGRNANAAIGTWGGNESDGWSGWGVAGAENYHRGDEWELWQEPAGRHSVTETGSCGPSNFITMTQSHQHTPLDESVNTTGGLEQDPAKQVWVQWGLLGSHPAAEAPSGNEFSSGTTVTLHYASCWGLTGTAFCQLNTNVTV